MWNKKKKEESGVSATRIQTILDQKSAIEARNEKLVAYRESLCPVIGNVEPTGFNSFAFPRLVPEYHNPELATLIYEEIARNNEEIRTLKL